MRIKTTFALSIVLVVLVYFLDQNLPTTHTQNVTNIIKNSTWMSISKNLTLSLELIPKTPIIDEMTRMQFELRSLSGSNQDEDIKAKVTVTDHDGRLYKFEGKLIPLSNGKFSVDYIFPDDGEHRVIVQLYRNTTPYTVSAFDLIIPHPIPPSTQDKFLTPLTNFFDSLLFVNFRGLY